MTTTMQYDNLNRLTSIVSNPSTLSYQLSTETKFLYDGWNLIAELDADGTNAGTYFPCYDGNHNIVAYVSAATGEVVARYGYDAFARLIEATGPMSRQFNILFSTKYHDWETGLYYYGYKYYDSETGRWPSRDPLGDWAFFTAYLKNKTDEEQHKLCLENLKPAYVFVKNDSVRSVDRQGLDRWFVGAFYAYAVVEVWDDCSKKVVGYKRIEFYPASVWDVAYGSEEVGITNTTKPGWNSIHYFSSCKADKFLLDWAYAMQADPPNYSTVGFNCWDFAAICITIK